MRRLFALYLPAALCEVALFFDWFAVQHLAKRWGADARTLGRFVAVLTLAYVSGSLLFGRLADGAARRDRLIVAAGLALALSFTSGLLIETIRGCYLQLAAVGLATAMFWPAIQAKIGAEARPGDLHRDLGGFNVAWTAGRLALLPAGPVFQASARACFWIAGAAGALAWGGAWTGTRGGTSADGRGHPPPPPPPDPLPGGEGKHGHPGEEARAGGARSEKPAFLLLGLSANFLVWGVSSLVLGLFPDLGYALGLDPTRQGICLGTLVFGQLAGFFVLMRRREWTYRVGPIFALEGGLVLATLALATVERWPLLLPALFVTGVATAVAYASAIFYSLDLGDGRPGYRAGIHEGVLGLGAFVVPLAGGEIAGALGRGPSPPYVFAAGLVATGMLFQAWGFARLARRARSAYETAGFGSAAGASSPEGGAPAPAPVAPCTAAAAPRESTSAEPRT